MKPRKKFPSSSYCNDQMEEKNIVHNIFQRFRKDDEFSGKPGDNIIQCIANDGEACGNYVLNKGQKLECFRNLFERDAKQCFRAYFQHTSNHDRIASQKLIAE